MSGETDLIKLYSGRILALAAEIPHTERLNTPQATVKKRAPLCGSTVTVDVALDDSGRLAAFGSLAEIEAARDALRAMLKEDGPTPPAPFADLEVLRPAREFANRHASILLALEATAEAMREAATAA
jgi:NifU-like protein involved in Fe-S cluster formation